MIDLDDKYINLIKNILNFYIKDYKLYLFGSRAKNNAREYSDIDIAIDSKELTSAVESKILFEFENSLIPYKIDFIDLNNISDNFKNLIKDDLVEI